MKTSDSAEKAIKDIKRATRRRFSPEDKIRIVIEGLRGEDSIAAICCRESIQPQKPDEQAGKSIRVTPA